MNQEYMEQSSIQCQGNVGMTVTTTGNFTAHSNTSITRTDNQSLSATQVELSIGNVSLSFQNFSYISEMMPDDGSGLLCGHSWPSWINMTYVVSGCQYKNLQEMDN